MTANVDELVQDFDLFFELLLGKVESSEISPQDAELFFPQEVVDRCTKPDEEK